MNNIIKRAWGSFIKTQVARFLISGQIMIALDVVPYYFLLKIFGDEYYMEAHNATTLFSNVINFFLQKYWVFNDRRSGTFWRQVFSYSIAAVVFALGSNFVLWFLVSQLNLSPIVGKLIKIGVMGFISWFVSSKGIFQGRKP